LWDYPSCIPAQKWHMNPLPLLIVWFGLWRNNLPNPRKFIAWGLGLSTLEFQCRFKGRSTSKWNVPFKDLPLVDICFCISVSSSASHTSLSDMCLRACISSMICQYLLRCKLQLFMIVLYIIGSLFLFG
jgi:hypothetical protein